jgi:hypothetical protein
MVIDFIKEEDKVKSRTTKFTLMPEEWQKFIVIQDSFPCKWKIIKLDEKCKDDSDLNKEPGIYTLLVQPGIASHPSCSYLMYVGKTFDLHKRFLNYLRYEKRVRKRPNIFRLLNIYGDHIWFCFTNVAADQLERYENSLMNAYLPPVNDENRLPAEMRQLKGAF